MKFADSERRPLLASQQGHFQEILDLGFAVLQGCFCFTKVSIESAERPPAAARDFTTLVSLLRLESFWP